jgi:ParB-like chromosome segregation protein Spo0J
MTGPGDRILYANARPDGRTPFWKMQTIWSAAEGKSPIAIRIDELNILDAVVWFGGPKTVEPTIRRVAERARDIFNADFTYPIIMTKSGDVLDGAHRIAKAYLQGLQAIEAVVLDDYPPPDGVA